jgi:hypothetical protein
MVGIGWDQDWKAKRALFKPLPASFEHRQKIFVRCHDRHEKVVHLALGLVFAVAGTTTMEP